MIFFLLPDYPSIYENVYKPEKKVDGEETTPVLAVQRQKFTQYFKGHLGFFRYFNICIYIYIYVYLFICMFIIRFLAEPWLENTALMVD